MGMEFFDLEKIISLNLFTVLLLAAFIGILPDSGPHFIFIMLFAEGLIPFSVLLTSSIVQDGHGMLPLMSASLKDSLSMKLFNLIIGLLFGITLFLLGY